MKHQSRQAGIAPLGLILIISLVELVFTIGGISLTKFSDTNKLDLQVKIEKALKESSNFLDTQKLQGSSFGKDLVGTVLLPDGSFSAFKVIEGEIEPNDLGRSTNKREAKIIFPSGDVGIGLYSDKIIPDFELKNGELVKAIIVDHLVANLFLRNGQSIPIKVLSARILDGKINGEFKGQTYTSGHLIVGQANSEGKIEALSVALGAEKKSEAQTIIAKLALQSFSELAFEKSPRLSISRNIEKEPNKKVLAASTDEDEDLPSPILDEETFSWSFGGGTTAVSTSQVTNIYNYFLGSISSLVTSSVGEQIASLPLEGIPFEVSLDSILSKHIKDGEVKTEDILDSSVTSAKLSDDSVTSSKIKDGEVKEADIAKGAVTSSKITDGTITTADFFNTLTFGDDTFIDLASITHNDSSLQGLRLPNVSNASPTNPSSGEGFVAYDTSNNQVIFYNGSAWGAVGSGDITSVTAGIGLLGGGTTGDLTLTIDATTSGTTSLTSSNSGLEADATGVSLLRGCSADQILKWNSTSKVWQCATDSGGAGSGIATIQEDDSTVVSSATVIDFLGADFAVTNAGAGEGDIAIDYGNSGIVRRNNAEVIGGQWSFLADVLAGGTSTSSARFALINMMGSGTPTASISANSGANNTYITGAGNLATTNMQALTLGGSSTGNIVIDSGSSSITLSDSTTISQNLTVAGTTGLTLSGNDADISFSGTGNHDITAGGGTLRLGALTLTGAISGGSQNITGLGTINGLAITADTGVITTGTWNATVIGTAYGGLGGNVTAAGGGEILYSTGTTTYDSLAAGASGYILQSGGTGAPSWVDPNSQTFGLWQIISGTIQPKNQTLDFLLGSTATSSAEFAVTGINDGTPTASISASTNGLGLSLTGSTATIQSLRLGTLTLGGATTGNIVIDSGSGVVNLADATASRFVLTNASGNLVYSGLSSVLSDTLTDETGSGGVAVFSTSPQISTSLTTGSVSFDLIDTTATTVNFARAATTLTMGATTGTIALRNPTLELGGTGPATIQTNSNDNLTLTPNGTGEIVLSSDFDSGVNIGADATLTPAPLSISGGIGANAALIVNRVGTTDDIFSASSSGTTRFVIENDGDLKLVAGQSIDTLTAGALNIGNTTANALTIGNSTISTTTFNVDTAGNFVFQKEGASYTCSGTDKLTLNGSGQLVCGTDQTGGAGVNWWNQVGGLVYPDNSGWDFAVGSNATASALFSFTGIKSGLTTASASGNLVVMPNNGYGGSASVAASMTVGGINGVNGSIQTTSNKGLTFGGNTTGEIIFQPNNGTGKVTIGSTTNGLQFDITNGGPTYFGSARPTKKITLSPEYAGAILTASDSASTHTGSMTSDASHSANLSNFMTYYEWTSSQTSLNDYTVVVRFQLPEDFSAWATSTAAAQIKFNTELANANLNQLDVVIYNGSKLLTNADQSTPVVYWQDRASNIQKAWNNLDIPSTSLDSGGNRDLDAPGEEMVIYLRLSSKDNNHVQVGDIVLSYLSKF